MKITKFEDLQIWQKSLNIIKKVYDLTSNEKFQKDWFLKDQLRRCSISISSNIVEGFERSSNNEFSRFLKIAKGSVGEARNQLFISKEIGYINEMEFEETNKMLLDEANLIGGMISYLTKTRNSQHVTKKLINKNRNV